MHLIDTHCHLDYMEDVSVEDILKRASDRGVKQMITIGTSEKNWQSGLEAAKAHPGIILFTVGIHPCYVDKEWHQAFRLVEPYFSQKPSPVAMGEIGLDFFRLPDDPKEAETLKSLQKEAFEAQLTLAKILDCPLIIHSRHAFNDCITMIDSSGVDWKKVIFHCFSEGPVEIRLLNERGGRASFTGIITYKKAENVREAALAQGLNKLILETDAPYLAPTPHRGKPNEPAYTRHIADFCAELFKTNVQTIAEVSTLNSRNFFGL